MPYRHGFLTPTLEDYLEHRSDMNAKERAVHDFHVRKNLIEALKDAVFVFLKLDKRQFDKISEELQMVIVELLSVFAERSSEASGKYPYGRIWQHKAFKVFTRRKAGDVLMDINRMAFDRISGKKKLKKDVNKAEVTWKSVAEKEEK